MSVTNGYCTVADVREQLNDVVNEQLSEALLERAVNASSRAVDRFCHRRFWLDAEPVARTYRPCEPYRADVDDIGTTAGLVIKTDTGGDGTWATTWQTGDYDLEPLNADADGPAYAWWTIVSVGNQQFFSLPLRPSLQVTARWGWSIVPDDVETAALLKAVSLFKRKDSPLGVAGFAEFGAVRISRSDPDVVSLLQPYVRPEFA
ncbi:hypothetical protein [Actinoallomurus sp. CA-142502]|uniref:hypothetical protein n=1 Tax=Actinoallomurus sp. CA-142502 TaxID=3239885 RepID=UPI003D8F2E1F